MADTRYILIPASYGDDRIEADNLGANELKTIGSAAAAGASIGSAFGPVGTAIGTGAGAVGGAVKGFGQELGIFEDRPYLRDVLGQIYHKAFLQATKGRAKKLPDGTRVTARLTDRQVQQVLDSVTENVIARTASWGSGDSGEMARAVRYVKNRKREVSSPPEESEWDVMVQYDRAESVQETSERVSRGTPNEREEPIFTTQNNGSRSRRSADRAESSAKSASIGGTGKALGVGILLAGIGFLAR